MKVLIVGLGNIGFQFPARSDESEAVTHFEAYSKHSTEVEFVGVDPDKNNKQVFQRLNYDVFDSLEEALESFTPDCVSICSPDAYHFEQVKVLMKKNIPHIWLEKPACNSLEEVRELSALKSKSRVVVNYFRRFSKNLRMVKDTILSGDLGTIKEVNIKYSEGLNKNGSHLIDALNFLLEDTVKYDLVSKYINGDDIFAIFMVNNSFRLSISGHALGYHHIELEILLTGGKILLTEGFSKLQLYKKVPNDSFPGFFKLKKESEFQEELGANFGEILSHLLSDAPNISPVAASLPIFQVIELISKEKK